MTSWVQWLILLPYFKKQHKFNSHSVMLFFCSGLSFHTLPVDALIISWNSGSISTVQNMICCCPFTEWKPKISPLVKTKVIYFTHFFYLWKCEKGTRKCQFGHLNTLDLIMFEQCTWRIPHHHNSHTDGGKLATDALGPTEKKDCCTQAL